VKGSVCNNLGAFGASFLGLPVVVAGADSFVAIETWGHTQALCTTLVAEEQAWLLVLSFRAPP